MLDLAAVASLRAVHTHGTVSAAAEALGYTPSAISQQVKRLEKQSGLPLLERVGRGVMLTEHGRRLVEAGSRVLTDLEEIEAGLHRDAEAVAGHLRIAAFSTAVRGLLAPVLREVLATHPALTLSLTEKEPWDTIDLVASGQFEIGLVHNWGDVSLAIPEHLAVASIAYDEAQVLVSRDHRLADRRRVTPHDLVEEGWIATPEGTICREWLHRMYDGTGRLPRIAHQSMEFDSHIALVRAGLGIALVPELGRAALPDDVIALEVRDPHPVREVIAVHRRSMSRSPAVLAVLDALRAAG